MTQRVETIYRLRPWYHDFAALGVQTRFEPDATGQPQNREHMKQQARKEKAIAPYVRTALAGIQSPESASVLDLFCADGYYGLLTQKLCPGATLIGVDRSAADIERCWCMASHLRLGPVHFLQSDVYEYVEQSRRRFDLVLCLGGLYHLPDPYRLIAGLRRLTGQYLVLQSAIPVGQNDPDYHETPNPWFKTWGSCFSHERLLRWVRQAGFTILESTRDSREEPNPEGIGGSYLLAK